MRKLIFILSAILVLSAHSQAQNGGNSYCSSPVSLANGWTANKCQLGFNFTTAIISVTLSPTTGHTILAGGYVCGNVACTSTPQATIVIGDNLNNPESCFAASPNSPHLANSTSAEVRWYWWVCPSIPSGVTQFEILNSNGNFGGALWIVDLTGAAASTPIDADGFAVGTTAVSSGSVSVTSVNATDLICGMIDGDSGGNDTYTAGYTALLDDGSGSSGGTGILQCKSQTSATTYTMTSGFPSNTTYEAYAIAIKAAAAATVKRRRGSVVQR